ncbi:E3 ubiquitin-protein ligase TRIM39-like [Anoplopoma fimbria]|uniref:E3 ubiquitin-protein ligase TRIM39-like n=1 Tax=Anoplopoma fimbria TaxID=229290 RepID=UPI0023EC833B|nr:E3 ubiquitin-protein ligase TRIM39-like [Anoplopoma fimbria]
MAAAVSLLVEDQFLCPICLDVFTDPVTVPCGHNFCKACITEHWDLNVQSRCPMCKEHFDRRPVLRVNPFISEIAAHFRQSVQKNASGNSCSSEEQHAKPGEVLCDICTETKATALKSCLVCLASYCESHLEPHQRIAGLKRHKLIDPVENLEGMICENHDRPLELFCKTDQTCVCQFCAESSHRLHHIVPLIDEYEEKKAELGKTEAEVQQMIQERRLKIAQIRQAVLLSKQDADKETEHSVQVFTALMQSVQRNLSELIETIDKKHKTTENQAEGFIKELEEEISELITRRSELEQLSRTEDRLHMLQSFPSLSPAPPTKDWTEVSVHSSYHGTVMSSVAQLAETLSREMKIFNLKRVQQFAVDVTLDLETAYSCLFLSDDGKQVRRGDKKLKLPDSPKRFSTSCVLGKQSFSSGGFYYEVQVEGKTDWVLGVAKESVNRKNSFIPVSPPTGYWTVRLKNGNQYEACAIPAIHIPLMSKPQKVGVFVDFEMGLVSFYDVDTAALMYSFTGCNFTEKLYPYLDPRHGNDGKNTSPLILCSINQIN